MSVAVVTGGAGGLGTAIADVLLADGHRVALVDVVPPDDTAQTLTAAYGPGRVIAVRADITVDSEVADAISSVVSRWDASTRS